MKMHIKLEAQKLIIDQVNYLVNQIQKLPNWPAGRNSGYCTIIIAVDGRPIMSFQIGECPREKFERYYTLSIKKAQRLLTNFFSHGHASSWESMDEKNEKFAGAISTGSLIISISGLPFGLADEAISLIAAVNSGLMSDMAAIEIAEISGNTFFEGLNSLCV